MPPKKNNRRKSQGKRKNSQQGSSKTSSPSNKADSAAASPPSIDTPTIATSGTVEQELITPGALDLRLSQPGAPNLGAVDEESLRAPPSASDVISEERTTPHPRTDDVEYQDEDGMSTPTAEVPQSAAQGATSAAAAAATGTGAVGLAAENPIEAGGASYAQNAAPPKSNSPKNPFRDDQTGSTVGAIPEKTQQTSVVEESTFDEVPLGPNNPEAPHRAMSSDEVPTLRASAPLASPPRPAEPFMQMDAAPDSAPADNFVSNGGANQATTAEPQNVWAPGQHGFERSSHAPSTTSAAIKDRAAANVASSSNFAVEDSSLFVVEDDEPNSTLGGQAGLWRGPTKSPPSEQLSGRQLTPTEGSLPNDRPPPSSYPYPAHAAYDEYQSPKSLLPSDPHLPLPDPDSFEPRANSIAPLGPSSTDNIRESIDLSELPEEHLDGFLNPWTRSSQVLAGVKHRAPSPAEIGVEEAAISTPELPELSKLNSSSVIHHTVPIDRTSSANSARSNEPLMPTTGLLAGKKYGHLNKITTSQLRSARPSVIMPRGPNKNSSKYNSEGTSSGRSSRNVKVPPPEIVEAEFDDIRIDTASSAFHSQPRDRFPSLITPAPVFMRARNEGRGQWARWNNMTRRRRLFIIAIIVVIIALVIGLAVGLVRRRDTRSNAKQSSKFEPNPALKRGTWEPKAGERWRDAGGWRHRRAGPS